MKRALTALLALLLLAGCGHAPSEAPEETLEETPEESPERPLETVYYTHMTLPTKRIV